MVEIEHQFQQFCDDAIVSSVEAIADAIVSCVEAIVPGFQKVVEELNRLWEAVLKSYQNKRVVHLVFHGKTARIRKKNINRIVKYIKKELKRNG